MRTALLKSQERLAELEGGDVEDRPELLQELDRLQEEILRLRDLLIGKDAELGAARGRLCELEDQNQRVGERRQPGALADPAGLPPLRRAPAAAARPRPGLRP